MSQDGEDQYDMDYQDNHDQYDDAPRDDHHDHRNDDDHIHLQDQEENSQQNNHDQQYDQYNYNDEDDIVPPYLLYVSYVPNVSTEDDVHQAFDRFGEILKIALETKVLPKSAPQHSNNKVAYVTFADKESLILALNYYRDHPVENPIKIHGVNLIIERGRQPGQIPVRVYVSGGLGDISPPNVNLQLREHIAKTFFDKHGDEHFPFEIVEIIPKGNYAFITLKPPSFSQELVDMMNGTTFNNHTLTVQISQPTTRPVPTIYIQNVPMSYKNDNVRDLFQEFGNIKTVSIRSIPSSNEVQIAFITYDSVEHAQAALDKMNNVTLPDANTPLLVEFARHERPTERRRGGDRDRGGDRGFRGDRDRSDRGFRGDRDRRDGDRFGSREGERSRSNTRDHFGANGTGHSGYHPNSSRQSSQYGGNAGYQGSAPRGNGSGFSQQRQQYVPQTSSSSSAPRNQYGNNGGQQQQVWQQPPPQQTQSPLAQQGQGQRQYNPSIYQGQQSQQSRSSYGGQSAPRQQYHPPMSHDGGMQQSRQQYVPQQQQQSAPRQSYNPNISQDGGMPRQSYNGQQQSMPRQQQYIPPQMGGSMQQQGGGYRKFQQQGIPQQQQQQQYAPRQQYPSQQMEGNFAQQDRMRDRTYGSSGAPMRKQYNPSHDGEDQY